MNEPDYDGTISVTGGVGSYNNLQIANLPAGLTASVTSSTVMVNGVPRLNGLITIAGTPTQSGTFNLQISLQDSNGNPGSGTDTLTITAAPITLGSLSPAQWYVNQSGYDGTISVSGGSGTYSNLQVTGLPTGLSASLSGSTITITGTPTQSGTFDLGVSLQDSNGAQGTGSDTLTINAANSTITLGALSPTQWNVNEPDYDGTISVSGGVGSYTNLQIANLPAGLMASVTSSTVTVNGVPQLNGLITIAGTPTQSGTFNLQISLQDSNGVQGTGSDTLTINAANAAITLGALSPTQWNVNQSGYDGTISVSGGSGTYDNLQVTGLPTGLSALLSGSTITIMGTPTQSGTFNLGVSLQDSNGVQGTGGDTLTINAANAAITLCALSPTQWNVNQSGYDGTISVSGGSGTYDNLQVTGLPTGLSASLSGSTITITGTPTQSGTFNLGVSLQDSNGVQGTGSDTLTIAAAAPITLGSLNPTQWDVNEPGYDGTISVSGGKGSYKDLNVTGLPTGLKASIVSSSVVVNGTRKLTGTIFISGTPTESGTFTLGVTLQDSTGATDYGVIQATTARPFGATVRNSTGATVPTFTLKINAAVTLAALSPAQAIVNQKYTGMIPVTGGSGSYSNASIIGQPVITGQPELSAAVSGGTITLSGTPIQSGTFTITVQVHDSNGEIGSRSYTLNVAPAQGLTLSPSTLPAATSGQPYSASLQATGGSGDYYFTYTDTSTGKCLPYPG